MVQGSAVRASQSPGHNPPGTMFSVTRGKSYPLPNPHYPRVLLSDLSTPTPCSGLLDLLNGVPGQGEISGALSFYNPGREASRPDMRTGSSSHNPTAPAGLRRVEAALSPERCDPLMRPGLIRGATDLREHSTYPPLTYGPETGGSCQRSHRKLVQTVGQEAGMAPTHGMRGGQEAQSCLLGTCLFSDL